MKERPILFSGAMVRAVLEGRKTKTRRVVKPIMTAPRVAPLRMEPWIIDGEQQTDDQGIPCWAGFHPDYPGEAKWFSCPYGKAGDQLWGRETFYVNAAGEIIYRADFEPRSLAHASKGWQPSIFMPRTHSRLSLEIASIGVERVQEITEADAIAEGVQATAAGDGYPFAMTARMNFVDLWDDINAKRGYGWAENPWVWVVEFRRLV